MNNLTTPDDEGFRIVLSPVQLAAILNRNTITGQETLSNRLWGGLDVVFGVLELIGAGALCLAPDPTLITKGGCVVLTGIGSDTAARGLRQAWSGRIEQSALEYTIDTLAKRIRLPTNLNLL
jgi:hypothetical protein